MNNELSGRILVLCPRCGESLSVDGGYDSASCPFCGGVFRVSEGARLFASRRPVSEPPRRKRHIFRWLLLCLVFFLAGRLALPGLIRTALNEREPDSGRALSAPAVTPRPTVTPRPAATPGPSSAPRSDGVSPEFKQYMDSYEAFFDEYLAFMASMDEEGDGFGVLLRYAEMMERYAEVMDSLDDIDEEELSTADEIYYLEVLSRIERKLLEASAD